MSERRPVLRVTGHGEAGVGLDQATSHLGGHEIAQERAVVVRAGDAARDRPDRLEADPTCQISSQHPRDAEQAPQDRAASASPGPRRTRRKPTGDVASPQLARALRSTGSNASR
jgi:hypothetical protein